jgi:hypothetical protein
MTRPCAFPETGKPEPKPMPVRGLRASAWGRKFGFSVSETAGLSNLRAGLRGAVRTERLSFLIFSHKN